MKTFPYAKIGKVTTWLTFGIATIIFLLYLQSGDLDFGFIGYFFFLFAVPANIILFIFLNLKAKNTADPTKVYNSAFFMLINIPVAIIYFLGVVHFTGIVRIRIENHTGSAIHNVHIQGCESEFLENLNDGKSKNIWISITGDCSIYMVYTDDAKGKKQRETIMGYVTNGMGQKITYEIGQGEVGF